MEKSVFIFDDDVDILELCRILLTQRGYRVYTANCCDNILEQVTAVIPSVIIMDNKIPDVGGIAAVRMLKNDEKTRDIPVIFFSANTNVKQLSEEACANVYLQKPFDISELEVMVENLIGGRSIKGQSVS